MFKKKERTLLKNWDDLYYEFRDTHKLHYMYEKTIDESPEEVFFQLIILRDYYNDGWIADWSDVNIEKYIIYIQKELTEVAEFRTKSHLLSFKTKELRDEFLNNFKELILKAKELL